MEHKQKAEFRQRIANYVASVEAAEDDLDDLVDVSHPEGIDFGVVDEGAVRQGVQTHLIVTTTLRAGRIRLEEAKIRPHGNSNPIS